MARTTLAILCFCLSTVAFAVAQDQWWCNGDGLQTGLSCERNTYITDGRTYDDFDMPIRAFVRGAWGNFQISFTPTQAYYEIRSGVSEGNGGTLHASGVMNVRASGTGRVIKGFTASSLSPASPRLRRVR